MWRKRNRAVLSEVDAGVKDVNIPSRLIICMNIIRVQIRHTLVIWIVWELQIDRVGAIQIKIEQDQAILISLTESESINLRNSRILANAIVRLLEVSR